MAIAKLMLIKTGRAARDKGKEHRYVQRLDVARWLDSSVDAMGDLIVVTAAAAVGVDVLVVIVLVLEGNVRPWLRVARRLVRRRLKVRGEDR